MRNGDDSPEKDMGIVDALQALGEDTVIEIGEVVLDHFIADGILKEVPLIRTFVGIVNGAVQIRDKLLMKKIVEFLRNSPNVSEDKRKKFLQKFESDPSLRERTLANLVLSLDRLDDIEKAPLLAKIFGAFLSDRIDYLEMRRLTAVLDRTQIPDLYALRDFILCGVLPSWDSYYGLEGAGIAVATHSMIRAQRPGEEQGVIDGRHFVLSPVATKFVEIVFKE